MTLCALLAFFLQGMVLQTHIHAANPATHTQTAFTPTPAPLPLDLDPVDQGGCRLCQELVHFGVFLSPAAAVTVTASLDFVTSVFAAPPRSQGPPAPAFAWQSRAPPRR